MQVDHSRERRERLLRRATNASVGTAAALILGKTIAWLITGSVSVLASLIDSLMDSAASVINLVAVRYSLKPADEEHRFGHGKSEALAALAQATFIAGSALFLIIHAIDRLLYPRPLKDLGVGIAVMVFATVATAALVTYQRYVVRETRSAAIRADSLHYVTDLLTNLSIIVALGLAAGGWPGLDPVFAISVALYILYSAWQIGFEAFHVLMDRELPEVQEEVRRLALSNPDVRGVHDVRTRQSGHRQIVQLHLELDDQLPLIQAHAIAQQVDRAIRAAYPEADIIIHQDPMGLGVEDPPTYR